MYNSIIRRVVSSMLVIVILAFSAKAQRSWYVSKYGDDLTGDGTKSNPFASIQKGVIMAHNNIGDTVKVAGGIYVESVYLKDYKAVKLIGSYNPNTWNRDLQNYRTIVEPGQSDYCIRYGYDSLIDGFLAQNATFGFYKGTFASPRYTQIKNCIARNCSYGIRIFACVKFYVESCYFDNCSRGIDSWQSGTVIMNNCVFLNCSLEAFTAYNFPGPYSISAINNTFYGSQSGIVIGINIYGYETHHIIKNNIITNCDIGIWYKESPNETITVSNNDFYNNDKNFYWTDIPIENNLYLDPEFVDPQNGDFHLLCTSPCIGAGTLVDILPYDIEGNPRPSPVETMPDLGAYEMPCIPSIEVMIDVKPDNETNKINPNSQGVIPVAILTSKISDGESLDFDATTVNPHSVRFGPSEAHIAHKNGHTEDVDGDGDNDLLLHFKTQETGIKCGDTEVCLSGETFNGEKITGVDNIITVGCEGGALGKNLALISNGKIDTEEFNLYHCYPNPFNPNTSIMYSLPEKCRVSLKIFNSIGQEVTVLVDGIQKQGIHEIVWSPNELPSGLYIIHLSAGNNMQIRKILYTK